MPVGFGAASAAACEEVGHRCARRCYCLKRLPKSEGPRELAPINLTVLLCAGKTGRLAFQLLFRLYADLHTSYASFLLCLPIKNKQSLSS